MASRLHFLLCQPLSVLPSAYSVSRLLVVHSHGLDNVFDENIIERLRQVIRIPSEIIDHIAASQSHVGTTRVYQ
jgi:hypothetical protein